MITKDELASRLLSACAEVKAAEGELTEIDSRFGDADHGLTMCKIATAIEESVRESEGGIQAMLDDVDMAVMTLNGGSAVPLWNTWLDGLQEAAPEGNEADSEDLKAMFANALAELSDISGAQVGDKTMMDALIPAVLAAQKADDDCMAILEAAKAAALTGARESEQYVSKFGRARSYKEQTIGTPDAGAVSTSLFFTGLCDGLK